MACQSFDRSGMAFSRLQERVGDPRYARDFSSSPCFSSRGGCFRDIKLFDGELSQKLNNCSERVNNHHIHFLVNSQNRWHHWRA